MPARSLAVRSQSKARVADCVRIFPLVIHRGYKNGCTEGGVEVRMTIKNASSSDAKAFKCSSLFLEGVVEGYEGVGVCRCVKCVGGCVRACVDGWVGGWLCGCVGV